ncbi:aryl-alcohol dehydrogenase-like predicted oxidoreductase [Kribbella steppae]|uniref:Aryl-alcohol dehydrogenase-like predicted oxidoreductase n=1 Tax=Kribbella steppae TaxID=2512223 RepID=A0A4R2HHA8_9ACTN|nr:aryl-alcohol dehydrogenase-like predicted oxidoreductase [Kribbella steppae]
MQNSQKNAPLPINLSPENAWRKSLIGDLPVERIGFGTKRLAGGDGQHTQEQAIALLRHAVELGVNHLDTADFYPSYGGPERSLEFTSLGWANDVVRRALAPYPEELVIATKIGPTEAGLASPDQLRALVEKDLRNLGRDVLDVVYLRQHGLDSVAEHFGALAELRDKGLIRHLALSNVRMHHIAQAQAIAPVVAVQNRYGVGFGRVNDEVLDLCGEQGMAFVPFFAVTAAGRETGGVATDDAVLAIAREHDATPAQIRIAWTLSRGDHVLAIPGTGSLDHLAENVAAGDLRLSPEQVAVLDNLKDD